MPKIKTEWNLKHLYKSDSDPQIERDMKAIEKAFATFEKKYRGTNFTSTALKLKAALDDSAELDKLLNGWKLLRYFSMRKDIDAENAVARAKAAHYDQRTTVARNKATFFRLELGKIPSFKQKQYLKDALLKDYRYLLKVIFDHAKHFLSEKEEQLANLLSQPAYSMWVDGQDKYLSSLTVQSKGKAISIGEATNIVHELPLNERHALHAEINKAMKEAGHYAEGEINAVYNFKKVMDELRGHKKPYSATVLSYENDEKTIEDMVALITKSFKISHRFYKLQAKLLGLKKMTLADRGVKLGKIQKKFEFSSALELVKNAFGQVDEKYSRFLHSFAENGQLDVSPKKGKTGGAYCSGGGDLPTFILLNHTDSVNGVETLAHEMGHAFHTELSKVQPHYYREYSFASAEVASTFFEQLVIDRLEKELSKKEYAILLHKKIQGDISTIFRQIAFFNFELELHQRIRKEGELSKEEMAKLMSKHLKSYLGPSVEVSTDDGYSFVYIGHFRRFFYVYSYAFGQLVSRAMYERWKEDKSYIKKIEQFLSAGGSDSPENVFKSIGIDVSNPKFFQAGLKAIEKDIDKLEKLTKAGK